MAFLHTSSSSTSTTYTQTPLTIFYSGTVNVFADVPPSKARAVMLLLLNNSNDSGSSPPTNPPAAAAAAAAAAFPLPLPPLPASSTSSMLQPPRKRSQSDLPFARKASLARFLERRKRRVENNVNQEAAPAASVEEEGNYVAADYPTNGDGSNQRLKRFKLG